MKARLSAAAVAGLILCGGGLVPPAYASNDLGHRMPDGTPTYMMRNGLTAGFDAAVEWVRVNEMNPTDLTTLYTSDVSQTYMNIVDSDYGSIGWAGIWDCAVWGSGNVCKRGDVYLNLSAAPGGSWDDTERRSLACEEIGHAVGLAHRYVNEGCMSQEWSRTRWTNDHDNVHINNWYS